MKRLAVSIIVIVALAGCALFEEPELVPVADAGSTELDSGSDSGANSGTNSGSGGDTGTELDSAIPDSGGTEDVGPQVDPRIEKWQPLAYLSFDSVDDGEFDVVSQTLTRNCIVDEVVTAEPGFVGNAATFGGGTCWIAHEEGWELAEGTLLVWVKPDFDSNAKAFISKGASGVGFSIFDAGGFFTLNIRDAVESHSTGPELAIDQWVSLALTWTGTDVDMWIDGERRGTYIPAPTWVANKEFLTIGADSSQSESGERLPNYNRFTGQVDEMWVFDRELDNVEMLDLIRET